MAESDLSGNITKEYIYFAGQRTAWVDASSGDVYYYYTDQIGSVRRITTQTGTPCYNADFTPYGQEIYDGATSCQQNYKFAGYERDSETGLDYAFARYYNSRLGRFTSPDPLAGGIGNPQSLNRYAYVLNNPVNLLAQPDKSGACPVRLDKRRCVNRRQLVFQTQRTWLLRDSSARKASHQLHILGASRSTGRISSIR